jgi:hypothetical protein
MKISTIREFRDRATTMLRSEDPILLTRRGRVAGVFLPWREATLPLDLKRELFSMLTSEIALHLKKRRISEQDVLQDFAGWQKERRETRRRR